MKKYLLLLIAAFASGNILAQDQNIISNLKTNYSQVQYNAECGGWYFLSYSKDGQTLYGFADKRGNVIASDAYKYKQHKGFIELYILDKQKQAEHEQWKRDYQQYQADFANYKRISAEYEAALNQYNANVSAARTEAERRYNAARQAAIKRAEAENQRAAQQNSGGGVLGAVLGGLSAGLNTVNAANSVKFEPYFDQVKGERGLISPPSKPYNPMPTEPKEPASGYEWRNFSLLQPCPYSYIEFDKIKEVGGFAKVTKDGKHGLVDAYMREVVPCQSTKYVETTWDADNICRVSTSSGNGIMDAKGNFIIPIQYNTMEKAGTNYIVSKNGNMGLIDASGKIKIPLQFTNMKKSNSGEFFCKDKNGWGIYTSSFDELYPCQFQNITLGTINGRRYLTVQNNGLWGALDFENGSSLLPVRYEEIKQFKVSDTEYDFIVKKDDKYGLYNDKGVNILPVKMSAIEMSGNNFKVNDGNTVGLYSSEGFEIIPVGKYSEYTSIAPGMYDVTDVNKKHGIYICSGQEIVPCSYSMLKIKKVSDLTYFYAQKPDGSKGIVSLTGQELFPFIYVDDFEIYNDFLVAWGHDNKWNRRYGCFDFDGNNLIPLKGKKVPYEKIRKFDKTKYQNSFSIATTKKEMLRNSSSNIDNVLKEHFLKTTSFSYFAQNYVERLINEWQIRGEFEKKEAYVNRVNQKTRQQKIYELTREAQTAYVDKLSKTLPNDNMSIVGQFDADNETYRIHSDYSTADLLVHVSPEDAQDFKTYFSETTKKPLFFVDNDYIGLAEYHFILPSGKIYKYSNQASLNYTIANVDYNFDEIVIDASASNPNYKKGKQTISSSSLNIGTSDVDVAIPRSLTEQPDTYALIIANELYSNEKNVDFAFNDGQVFREYCIRALGIPEKNVQFRSNATLNDMRFDFNWLKQMANVNNGKAKFIVYYAGHGMPDDSMKDSYLLPVDGYSSDVKSGYKLSDLYSTLSDLPAENVTVYLDACFSGSQRSGEVMASVRGVAITPYITRPKGNLMVFSATSGKETAQPYPEKYHGLFTYFLLKKIKEHQGELLFGDLEKYVSTEVQKVALSSQGRKSQTPCVTASEVLTNWQGIRVK